MDLLNNWALFIPLVTGIIGWFLLSVLSIILNDEWKVEPVFDGEKVEYPRLLTDFLGSNPPIRWIGLL
jgi:hypothetical protein